MLSRKVIISAILISVVLLSSCASRPADKTANTPDSIFTGAEQTIDTMENVLVRQSEADKKIRDAMGDAQYTFDEPLVLENPYEIAPMTALIIFCTDKETKISATINDRPTVEFASSKEHAIPVCGLYDDCSNRIVLSDDKGNTHEVTIDIPEYTGGVMKVEQTYDEPNDEFYFVSPDYENTSIYDKDGRLLWYLATGNNEDSPFQQAVVYMTDAETMDILQSLDIYEILHDIAPEWVESLGNPFNVVINGINYDEESGDVLLSLRATSMLMRVNLETGEIRWIFADPDIMPTELHDYLLKPKDDTRYPYGQHACMFMNDGRIAYHNNDIDLIRDKDQHLSNYLERYSSNEIIEVDEEAKSVRTVWTYDADREVFSKMSGSLEFLPDGHKLLSYGSALKAVAYENPETAEIVDSKYTNGLMLELNENDELIWRATFPGVMQS